ncbi:hypothetical protein LZ32DRAFT_204785 [Colletotrichum eremochloae]|nr:hypothetical protein LZ32DRAFT_204785 [Colletotrichum eremochloae]
MHCIVRYGTYSISSPRLLHTVSSFLFLCWPVGADSSSDAVSVVLHRPGRKKKKRRVRIPYTFSRCLLACTCCARPPMPPPSERQLRFAFLFLLLQTLPSTLQPP